MSRILVACHSRTGYTRSIGERLAKRLGADFMPIDFVRPRAGAWGYLRCAWDALRGIEADLAAPARNPKEYDLLVLGTPVWAGHASSPARTFARRFGIDAERVALFCTMGGSGATTALAELQQDLRHTPLATLAMTDREIDTGMVDYKIASFANAFGFKIPSPLRAEAA